jgi:hypothetical protein
MKCGIIEIVASVMIIITLMIKYYVFKYESSVNSTNCFRNETSLFLIGSSMHIGIFLKWQTKQWVDDNIFIQA